MGQLYFTLFYIKFDFFFLYTDQRTQRVTCMVIPIFRQCVPICCPKYFSM